MTRRQYESIITHLEWIKDIKNKAHLDCTQVPCDKCNLFDGADCLFKVAEKVTEKHKKQKNVRVHP